MKRFVWQAALVAVVVAGMLGAVWGGSAVLGQAIAARVQRALPGRASVGVVAARPWGVAIGNVRWNFSRVSAEPIVSAHRIILQPSFGAMLVGRLLLSRITVKGLAIVVARTADGRWNFAADEGSADQPERGWALLQRFAQHGKLLAQRLEIQEGRIRLEDQAVEPPVRAELAVLRLVIQAMPTPQHLWAAHVNAHGTVRARPDGREGTFHLSGWVDPVRKDLEAKFHIADVELGPLEPYYQGKITRVRAYEGRLTLQGTASARANVLTMRCTATFSQLAQGDLSVLGRTIVDVGGSLGGSQGELAAEFTVSGPLDAPAQWRYQLGPNQAPLLLLFLPFTKQSGETTIIKMGPTQLDVGPALEQWLGPAAPLSTTLPLAEPTPADGVAPITVPSGATTMGVPPVTAAPQALSPESPPVDVPAAAVPATPVVPGANAPQ